MNSKHDNDGGALTWLESPLGPSSVTLTVTLAVQAAQQYGVGVAKI